ncbi:hypothetical protein [Nocardioides sp. NPDC004968]|uniref:hypothetical protein n=1 Tax=Nocardioides sp. NPDC004968 TaxID=3155894 RepID=UPI0033AAEB69
MEGLGRPRAGVRDCLSASEQRLEKLSHGGGARVAVSLDLGKVEQRERTCGFADREGDRDGFCQDGARDERKHVEGGVVDLLSVLDEHQHGVAGGAWREQGEDGEAEVDRIRSGVVRKRSDHVLEDVALSLRKVADPGEQRSAHSSQACEGDVPFGRRTADANHGCASGRTSCELVKQPGQVCL